MKSCGNLPLLWTSLASETTASTVSRANGCFDHLRVDEVTEDFFHHQQSRTVIVATLPFQSIKRQLVLLLLRKAIPIRLDRLFHIFGFCQRHCSFPFFSKDTMRISSTRRNNPNTSSLSSPVAELSPTSLHPFFVMLW